MDKGRPNDLTDAQKTHIRRLWRNGTGLTMAELSRRFCVSRYVIDNVVTRHLEYKPVNFTTDARK